MQIPALILWLAFAHAAAATSDGFSTKYWERACPSCVEEPIERAFIGRRPTWPRMLRWGAAEVSAGAGAGMLLHHWRATRRISWLPQAVLIAEHLYYTAWNYERRYPRRGSIYAR